MNEQRNESKSVPLIIYESEMKHKTNIIKGLLALLFTLVIILGISIFLFVKFISNFNFIGYDQDGNGINNVNAGTQGDIINESTITNDD